MDLYQDAAILSDGSRRARSRLRAHTEFIGEHLAEPAANACAETSLAMLPWLDTHDPGRAARRALRALCDRTVADLRHHAARQSRAWRPDHLRCFSILALSQPLGIDSVSPSRSRSRSCSSSAISLQALFLNRTLGPRHPAAATGHLRPFDHHPEWPARGFTADSRRLPMAGSPDTLHPARRRHRGRRHAAAQPCCRGAGHSCCSTSSSTARPLGRAFRATSDDGETAQLMGIDNRRIYSPRWASPWRSRRSPRCSSGQPGQFRSDRRPGAADLRLRGGDHRRPRQPLGDACRRHGPRRRPDRGCADQSGVADPCWAPRFSRRAGCPAARLLPARGGLSVSWAC